MVISALSRSLGRLSESRDVSAPTVHVLWGFSTSRLSALAGWWPGFSSSSPFVDKRPLSEKTSFPGIFNGETVAAYIVTSCYVSRACGCPLSSRKNLFFNFYADASRWLVVLSELVVG